MNGNLEVSGNRGLIKNKGVAGDFNPFWLREGRKG